MGDQIEYPCCGATMDGLALEQLMYLPLTEVESDIVEKLVTDHPRRLTAENLKAFTYAFRDEPETNAFNVQLTRLRKKLGKAGWTITNNKSGRGNKAKYKLERTGEDDD